MPHSEDSKHPTALLAIKLESSVLQSKPSKFAVRIATWRMSVQMALAGTAAAVLLMAGLAVCRADPLDTSLIGALAASAADCARLFQPRGGAPAFRQPVDKFAQALTIRPQQIVTPSSTCRLRRYPTETARSRWMRIATTPSAIRPRPRRSQSDPPAKSYTVPPAIRRSTPL
jgi:hypothetical protein